jgi:hypothetical protein
MLILSWGAEMKAPPSKIIRGLAFKKPKFWAPEKPADIHSLYPTLRRHGVTMFQTCPNMSKQCFKHLEKLYSIWARSSPLRADGDSLPTDPVNDRRYGYRS